MDKITKPEVKSIATPTSDTHRHCVKTRSKRRKRVHFIHLGSNKHVTVRRHNKDTCVNIRSYLNDDYRLLSSTKRGILLNLREWETLKHNIANIDAQLKVRKTQTQED